MKDITISRIRVNKKIKCCTCKKAILPGEDAIRYTYIFNNAGIISKTVRHWCIACEERGIQK